MKKRLFLLIVMIGVGIPSFLWAADVARIGVVDYQEILKRSLAGKKVAEKLNEVQTKRADELTKLKNDIVVIRKALEETGLQDTVTKRKEKQVELSLKLKQFNETEQAFTLQLKNINQEYTSRIKESLDLVVKKIGQKGGYLLVLEKEDVLYSPHSTDITEQVIAEFDQTYKDK
jgi:outer membrane protein